MNAVAVFVQLVLLLGPQVKEIAHNVLAAEQLGLNASHYGTRRAAHACALDVHGVQPAADAVARLSGGTQLPALALDSDGAR